MSFNFPHREAVVSRDRELRVARRLAVAGEIKVRGGERVAADHHLGRADVRLLAIRLGVAEQLGITPREVAKHLTKPVGATVAAGETVARARRGFRVVVVVSPIDATIAEIDGETGAVSLVPTSGGEVTALVPGDIEYADNRQAVIIRTVGSRVLGIIGLGPTVRGPLFVAVDAPDQELAANRVTKEMAGTIVVGGTYASAAALTKLVEVGALAFFAGGLVEREVAAFLGGADDRLARWRPLPGSEIIADGLSPKLALVATEGFGAIAMNTTAFTLLRDLSGRVAVLQPATRATAPLLRPELIIPNEELLDEDASTSQAAVGPGAEVRLVAAADLGLSGRVVSEPRRERLADGFQVDVAEVAVAAGGRQGGTRLVPLANLEVLVSHG